MRQIAQREARYLLALKMAKSFLKAGEEAHSNEFHIKLHYESDRLRNGTFRITEIVRANLSRKGLQDDIYDRNVRKWAQLLYYMNIPAQNVPPSS